MPGQVLDQVGGPSWMSSRCGGAVTRSVSVRLGSTSNSSVRRMRAASSTRKVHAEDATDLRHLQIHDLRRQRRRIASRRCPCTTAAPACCRISSAARSAAGRTISGWMPRLKRSAGLAGQVERLDRCGEC